MASPSSAAEPALTVSAVEQILNAWNALEHVARRNDVIAREIAGGVDDSIARFRDARVGGFALIVDGRSLLGVLRRHGIRAQQRDRRERHAEQRTGPLRRGCLTASLSAWQP